MMVPSALAMRIGGGGQVDLVGPHLQPEHGLDILAGGWDTVRGVRLEVLHLLESLAHLGGDDSRQLRLQLFELAALDRFLSDGDDGTNVQPGWVQPGVPGFVS